MLTDRTEMSRVFADQEVATHPWWQVRTNRCDQYWSRRAVEARISVSHAVVSSIAGQICAATAELRWKRFLRQVYVRRSVPSDGA